MRAGFHPIGMTVLNGVPIGHEFLAKTWPYRKAWSPFMKWQSRFAQIFETFALRHARWKRHALVNRKFTSTPSLNSEFCETPRNVKGFSIY
jgi:hypothetical protein